MQHRTIIETGTDREVWALIEENEGPPEARAAAIVRRAEEAQRIARERQEQEGEPPHGSL